MGSVKTNIPGVPPQAQSDLNAEQAASPYGAFPAADLPEVMSALVQDGSAAINCDPGYVGLPLLVAAAAAIGTTAQLEVKKGFREYPTLWGVLVGDSGTAKTPALRVGLEAIKEADKHLRAPVTSRPNGVLGGAEPAMRRTIVGDITMEALAELLSLNPRGLLMCIDEFAGWITRMDRYANSAGGDMPAYLSMFEAQGFSVDRKSEGSFVVEQGALSIIGGVQPAVLSPLLRGKNTANGLFARLLFVRQPRRQKKWSEAEVTDQVLEAWRLVIEQLLLRSHGGDGLPEHFRLHREAKARWVAFVEELYAEEADMEPILRTSWSKLDRLSIRLALVLHLVEAASDGNASRPEREISLGTIEQAIGLTRYFGSQAAIVVGELHETKRQVEQRELCEWMRAKGGRVLARDLQRARSRRYEKAWQATKALEDLAEAGYASKSWTRSGPDGGAPTTCYSLNEG